MPPVEVIEKRTRNSKTHHLGGRRYSWDGTIGSIHYEDGGWQGIDNYFEPAVAPWNWQMLRAGYHIRVKEDFTAGQIIEFEKQGKTVQFQPMALEWTNDLDMIQQISMPQNVTPTITNPEVDLLPNMPSHRGTIRWDDGYGQGIDFEWRCTSTRLVKILEIENLNKLPVPEQYILDGGNPILRLNLIFAPSSLDIYVDGELWDKKSKKQTFKVIEFRKDTEVLWGFMPLRYWGSGEAEDNYGLSVATLNKSGNKFYISIRVPYDWLQNATYPVFIDTTVEGQVEASSDDAFQDIGTNMRLDWASIDLHSNGEYGGWRFEGVNIPSGATVDDVACYLSLYLDDDADDLFDNKTAYCENASNPGTFTTDAGDISGRDFTSNSTALGTGGQGTGWKNTPSLVDEVQEVVTDQGGTGDALIFIIACTGGEDLDIVSWDSDPDLAAKLHIEYTVGGASYSETATVLIGVKPLVARTLTYSNLATVLIGVKPIASRVLSLIRTAVVQVGVKATGIASWVNEWVETALVYIGIKPIASRILSYTNLASVLVGIKPTATRIMSYVHIATTQIGIKSITILGLGFIALVQIGVKPIASRALSYVNSALVLVGIKPIASRVLSISRTATVQVGIKATASVEWIVERFIELTLNLYSRAITINLYARSAILNLYSRIATLNLFDKGMGWLSPTGHDDPDSKWTDETKAYDDDTETFGLQAFLSPVPGTVPKYLELTLTTPIYCDKVRIIAAYTDNAFPANHYDPDVLIDAYYNDGWHNIKDGVIAKQTWVEISLPNKQLVSAARIKMNGFGTDYWRFEVYEFDFWRIGNIPLIVNLFKRAISIVMRTKR